MSKTVRRAMRVAIPLAAAGAAVLISLALPPSDVSLLSWVCLVPFLLAIRACRRTRGSAAASIVFVLVFGTVYARWLPGTIEQFFRLTAVPAFLSAQSVYAAFGFVPIGLFAMLTHRLLRSGRPFTILLAVPCLWVGAELFRVHLLGGLPWALLGHALYRQPTLIQVADLTGVFGVSFLIATVNAGIFLLLTGSAPWWRRALPLGAALALLAVAWIYGTARVRQVVRSGGPQVTVALVQPNIAPVYRWTQLAADRALLAYLRLSQRQLRDEDIDLVVWPENALPLYPERDQHLEARLARLAQSIDAPLILGAPALDAVGTGRETFNAAHLIVPAQGITATYHKQRLVPFAEYLPTFGPAAPGAPTGRFVAGDGPAIFTVDGMRIGPTICLDFVFADVVRATVRAGAELLVNLSNDSWLTAGGSGAAVQQHAQAVFRAVENRRDVVRATTTGISAAVSATGDPLATLPHGDAGVLVQPVRRRNVESVYSRWGDVFALCCSIAGALAVGAGGRRPIRS